MCLQRILQKTKTNKMVPVWKVVRRSDNYHKFGIYFQGKIVKKGVNKAHIVNIFSSEDGIKHKSGFFCFMNRNIIPIINVIVKLTMVSGNFVLIFIIFLSKIK